uniref:Uncharacterized protein n=1 Tax=Anguilla anguilla TaxID=7936 RepID=A0A0E9Y0R8_ANGAN
MELLMRVLGEVLCVVGCGLL